MTLDEARAEYDRLRTVYDAIWVRLPNEGGPGIARSAINEEDERELRFAEGAMHRHMETVAGFPELRPHLWCWMVDVHGTESNMCGDGELEEGLSLLLEFDKANFAARAGGALAQQVHTFITDELEMRVSDSGGGCGSWHLGTPCDGNEMALFTSRVHERFAKAIAAGLLKVQVKFWHWRFKESA